MAKSRGPRVRPQAGTEKSRQEGNTVGGSSAQGFLRSRQWRAEGRLVMQEHLAGTPSRVGHEGRA